MTRATLTRVFHFSAAHRLHSPYLDDAENRALYRDCNNYGGHGHNYVLEVSVSGPVDARTGMVFDLMRFDALVQDRVVRHLDHQFIGQRDFSESEEDAFISTSEVITYQIWTWLMDAFPDGVRLKRIRLEETGSNHFEYRGEDHPARPGGSA